MFGYRNRRILALLILLAALAAVWAAAADDSFLANVTPVQYDPEGYDLEQADVQLTYRNGTEKADGIDNADSLTLLFFGENENPLPADAVTLMFYNLPKETAVDVKRDIEADTVACEYEESENRLYFRWKNRREGVNAFSVTVPVKKRDPFYTVNHMLREDDGNERLYLSEHKPFISGVLVREAPIEIEGYEGENAPYETEKRSDYDDVITFYYSRKTLHYQVDYLAVDGTVLRPRATFSGEYGEALSPAAEISGYRYVYCDQGDLPLRLTEENQYISLRYASPTASWTDPGLAEEGEEQAAVASTANNYIVRHVIPAEYTYIGQEIVLKTSAGTAGNPAREKFEQFDGKYYCDESLTQITESGVSFYYRPVQLSVKLNFYEGYVGEDGPVRRDTTSGVLRESQTLALWYGQDFNIGDAIEKRFTSGGVEYTFIGTDNVNRDLIFHGTEENRIFNLYYIGSVTQATKTTYHVIWKNYDGVVLETDQSVESGETPSYNSITPMRPADEMNLYEFSGWSPTPETVSGDAEYTATFTPIPRQYTVRFVNEDGTEIASENLTYGAIPEADTPEKESTKEVVYRFSGWDPEIAPVTGDAVYRAVFTEETRVYLVRFTDEEGHEVNAARYQYGTPAGEILRPAAPEKEPTEEFTYSFKGWEPELADVTQDAEYKATYEPRKRSYRITWTDDNGRTLEMKTLEYGVVPEYEAPAKDPTEQYSFSFKCWEPEITPVNGNATYKAVYDAVLNKYPITWQNEDGSDIEIVEAEYGTVPTHDAPEKEPTEKNVYVFDRWDPTVRSVTGTATYRATFTSERRYYKVRFLTEDGEEISSGEYRFGTQVKKINVPEKPQKEPTDEFTFEFAGWSPEVTDVTADADYTAVFNQTRRTYRITWTDDEGRVIGETRVAFGEMPEAPAAEKASSAEKDFTFTGWEPEVAEVTGDASYRAVYTEKTREYTVRFTDDTGREIASAVHPYGTPAEDITVPEAPAKEETAEYSYSFAGWTPEIGPVVGDTAYQAAYTATKRTYTIRFTDENGEMLSESVCAYGTPANEIKGPPIPGKEATEGFTFTFAGWDPAVTDVTGDAVYKAVFTETRIRYPITWLRDDGSVLDVTDAEYGTVPEYAAPSKEATAEFTYTFTGWTPEPAEVKGEAAYQAVFEAKTREYTVRFVNEDGEEIVSAVYPYGTDPEAIQAPEAPEKESSRRYEFSFTGWTPAVTAVTGDATYAPAYERKERQYTVRFVNDDGTELASSSYTYDTGTRRIQVPEDPQKEPTETTTFAFAGWDKPITRVREDAVYTATYTEKPRLYTVRFTDGDGNEVSAARYAYGAEDVIIPEGPEKAATADTVYTFTGWEPEVAAAVTADAEYHAVYSAATRSYTVRFVNENGEEVSSAVYEYGTPAEGITVPEPPAKENTAEFAYSFAGWQPQIAEVTGDAVYQAVFNAEKRAYTIRFLDGTGEEMTTAVYPYGTAAKEIEIPEAQAEIITDEYTYTFAKWQPDVADVTGDASYQAAYRAELRSYRLHFVNENGEEFASADYPYGTPAEAIEAPAAPEKAATVEEVYSFDSWEPALAPVTGEATYRAVYRAEPRPYTVRFIGADDEVISEKGYGYGTAAENILLPETVPVKAATAEFTYTFMGWEPALAPVTGDAEYRALFDSEKNRYPVTWLNEDGSEIETSSAEYGSVPEHTAPEKEDTAEFDYTFAGWQPEIREVTGSATYQAAFTAAKQIYTVRFVTDTDEEILAESYPYGTPAEEVKAPRAPEKAATEAESYSFTGWDPAVTEVTQDAAYRAVYTAQPRLYTVRFTDADGEEISSAIYAWGTAAEDILLPEAPVKAGTAEFSYTFAGWEPAIVPVAGDAVYHAVFTEAKNQYQISWLSDDGSEMGTTVAEYGTTPEHAAPEKENTAEFSYTFAGWSPEVTAVTGDASYQAVFTAERNSYTVRFTNENGEELTSAVYPYGTPVSELDIPRMEDKAPTESETYPFAGWEPAVTSVEGDVTYRAVYNTQPRLYSVRFVDGDGKVIADNACTWHTAAEEIPKPENPGKTGTAEFTYVFTGWEPEVKDVTEDAVYRAVFSEQRNVYQITWLDGDGNVIEITPVEYGATPEHDVPVKENTNDTVYVFKTWKPALKTVTEDATYQALYEEEIRRYRVRFLNEAGEVLTEHSYRYGTEVGSLDIPKAPRKEDTAQFAYSFTGWDPEPAAVTAETDYKPVYTETLREYRVSFVSDDGTEIASAMYPYGTAAADVVMPETPVKAATAEFTYSFTGWEPAVEDVTGDMTYRAVFSAERNKYLITWRDEDGTDIGIVEAEYGTELEHDAADKEPSDEFLYTFSGWEPQVTTVTGDAVYTAVYIKVRRSYTVTWLDAQGAEFAKQTLEYGTTPVMNGPAKEETETEAYAFTGWEPAPGPVTGDIVYSPTYSLIRKITVAGASESFEYDGKAHTSDGYSVIKGELAEGDILTASTYGRVTDVKEPAENTVDKNTVRVKRGGEDVTAEYKIELVTGQLTVTPRKVTVVTGSAEKQYDGTPLTDGTGTKAGNASVEGLAGGETLTVLTNGEITDVGTAENTYVLDWGRTEPTNYEVVSQPGTLTVTENPAEILIQAGSAEKTYDGKELTMTGFTVSGLPEGFTVKVETGGSQTETGTSTNSVTGWQILNGAGEDRSASFTGVTTADGTLTVNPAPMTITTGSAEKEYDGTPLACETATAEGLAEGESVTLAGTSTLTGIGMTENLCEVEWSNAKESNYTVEYHYGTLMVEPNTTEITLTTGSATGIYDGKPLTNEEIIAEGLPEGFTVEGTVTGARTQAGTSQNLMDEDYHILNAEGEDCTECFANVTVAYGTLTVKPRRIVITTGSAEKEYDGNPLWNDEIRVEGLAEGESITLRTSGSRTEVGTSRNTYLVLWDHAKASNYIIEEKLGKLTINNGR